MKKKKYWLRGGLIALAVWVVSFALTPLFMQLLFIPVPLTGYLSYGFLMMHILFHKINGTFSAVSASGDELIIVIVVELVLYFISGAVFGWLYGYVQTRRQANKVLSSTLDSDR